MIKRTLFFSNPYHLSSKLGQLHIACKKTGEVKQAPIEDLGFVVLDDSQITFSLNAMNTLAANNTAVIICNEKHMPSSMMFHLDTNQVQNERFRAQVNASEPLKKQLWQQTIKAKIKNQAAIIDKLFSGTKTSKINTADALRRLATQVKSGDVTNQEANAARRYWSTLFGNEFTRERFGVAPNAALNYGYAILRAAVARGLCSSGLLPTLGIHHHNKYNAYCLADDIMEPYRPFVDAMVLELAQPKENLNGFHNIENLKELDKETRVNLLKVISEDTIINGKRRPLMIAISETTASLASCFKGESKKIKYPELI